MRFSRTRRARLQAALALTLLALVLPGAAEAKPVPLDDVTLEVQLMPEAEPGTNVLIVGVKLPEGTPLPATVRLPLPAGARVFWAGEVTGGSPQDDLLREFTIVEGVGGQAIEFTAEETLTVQYDATYGIMNISGNDITTSLQWLQTVATGEISFGVRIPPRNVDVRLRPDASGPPQTNSAGESLYTLTSVRLEPGSEYAVSVAYRRAGITASPGSGSLLMPVLLGALAVAVVALFVVARSQRVRADATGSYGDE